MSGRERMLRQGEFREIRENFPGIPRAVAQAWLAPHCFSGMWPPDESDGWKSILADRKLDWWPCVSWVPQRLYFDSQRLVERDRFELRARLDGFGDRSERGVEGVRVQSEFHRCAETLAETGRLTQPIIFLRFGHQFEICSGFERLAAYEFTYRSVHRSDRPRLDSWVGHVDQERGR